ncbi:hypothetical protein MSUIS_05140 [Mycoplasma suis KI3806]|uniref:Uncharacterized protein n=1 Tax=Mycoplasma suis (strain KI_3806) TaxID=708248 RepID=F0V1S6_MYCS3|nr:hypothetical protein [Mycoplasma suis]CBZ40607.1 hypothetical protein MSUIS_05140 [Mycoplasma suis KI3806]
MGKNQGQDNLSQYFPKGNFEETCQSVIVGEDNFLFECTNTNGRNGGGTDSQHKNNPVEVIYSY